MVTVPIVNYLIDILDSSREHSEYFRHPWIRLFGGSYSTTIYNSSQLFVLVINYYVITSYLKYHY